MIKSGLFLAASILAAAPTVHAELAPAMVSKIDALFAGTQDGPGCSVGIYDQGKVVFAKGYGYANLENRVPITADSVFDIGSVSKQFTAMSVVLLAQEGKLKLDDDVRKYLPELRDYGTTITIRHLLNHTSGIRDFITLLALKGLTDKDYYTISEIYDILGRQQSLAFTPGSAFSYSNSGYFLLGEIVARASGKSLAAYAQAKIFAPLGMKHSHFNDNSDLVIPRRAYAYYGDAKSGYRVGGGFLDYVGDGGVFTTVRDLQLWDEDFYRGKVWTPAVKEEMLRVNKLTNGQPIGAEDFGSGGYASGLHVGKWRGLPVVRHSGGWVGYVSDFVRFPQQHFSVAVLCNNDSQDPTQRTGQLADLFLEKLYTEPKRPDHDADETAGKGKPIPADILAALPGTYYNTDLDTHYVVETRDGNVVFVIGTRKTRLDFAARGMPWRFLGNDTLGGDVGDLKLQRGADGKINGFAFMSSRTDGLVFKRVAANR